MESPKGRSTHTEGEKPKEEVPSKGVVPPPEEKEKRSKSKRRRRRRSRSEESSRRRERRQRRKEKRKSPVSDKERRLSRSEESYEEEFEEVPVEPEPDNRSRSHRGGASSLRPSEPAYPPGHRSGWQGPIPARNRREEREPRHPGWRRQKPLKSNKGKKKRERQHQFFGQNFRRGR